MELGKVFRGLCDCVRLSEGVVGLNKVVIACGGMHACMFVWAYTTGQKF